MIFRSALHRLTVSSAVTLAVRTAGRTVGVFDDRSNGCPDGRQKHQPFQPAVRTAVWGTDLPDR